MNRESLIGRPVIRPKIQRAKLGMCLLAGVLVALLASIFIAYKRIHSNINTDIDNIALLKDSNFMQWGKEQGSEQNDLKHSFYLYEYKGDRGIIDEASFQLTDAPVETKYSFEYVNASFGQGNAGLVSLINTWERSPLSATNASICNFNLGLNKVFNELTSSPIQTKFPVVFKNIITTLKTQFLPIFYSEYLWLFFFNDTQLVKDTILTPLNFSSPLQDELLQDKQFGWGSSYSLRRWMGLSLSRDYVSEDYFLLRSNLNLNFSQIKSLVGPGSQMDRLTAALNATIKNKIRTDYQSICQNETCTDNELVATQLSEAFLTTSTFMASINLNLLTGELNRTHQGANIEYSEACKFYNNSDCLDIEQMNDLVSGSRDNFLNFTFVNFVVENQNNPTIIEKFIHLDPPGLGQSVVDYVVKYFYKTYTIGVTNQNVFSWVWLVYQNFNKLWSDYRDLLITNLFGRALYNKKGQKKCTDYFTGEFEKYASVCNKSGYNLGQNIQSYFPYVRAYFFMDRASFIAATSMTVDQTEQFFSSPSSPFYLDMKEILTDFNDHYSCLKGECTVEYLVFTQWGSNKILSKLPEKYFAPTSVSILDWDTDNLLHNYNIEYWNVSNRTLEFTAVLNIMSYDQDGVLGQFSLKNRVDKGEDVEGMIPYLNDVLINSVFGGLFVTKESKEYLLGYPDEYLKELKKRDLIDGGKPWITGNVELVKSRNIDTATRVKPSEYDELNTGISDRQLIRKWKKRLGHMATGYKYPITIQDSNVTYTWVDTGRPVDGTNLYGFHTSVTSDDTLTAYIEDLHSNVVFKFDSYVADNKLKFVPNDPREYFVGNDTLDGFYARIIPDQSYLIVESATGQTLEFKFLLDWYIRPGAYLFNVSATSKALLFQQSQYFSRPNQDKYNTIVDQKKLKKIVVSILISLCCLCVVCMGVLGVFIWRKRKNLIRFSEDEVEVEERIDTRPGSSVISSHYGGTSV